MKRILVVLGVLAAFGAAIVLHGGPGTGGRSPAQLALPDLGTCVPPSIAETRGAPAAAEVGLRAMISGLLVAGFVGDRPSDPDLIAFLAFARSYPLGGFIVLRRNVATAADVRAINAALGHAAAEPPFLMIDEEGGIVSRLRGLSGFPRIPAARQVAASLAPGEAQALYGELAWSLAELGFNVNLAPVVDLERNPSNPVIARHRRSFSADPRTVVSYGRAFARAHGEAGVLTALKHFPSHGSSDTDTHVEPADVSESWHPDELVPFAQLAGEGLAPFIMTSHVAIASPRFGEDAGEIATFSASIVSYIRHQLCHDGLVITDDITMAAVAGRHTLAEAVEKAVRAGHDLVLIAAPDWIGTDRLAGAIEAVAARAADDPALAAAIEAAFTRVLRFKREHLAPAAPLS